MAQQGSPAARQAFQELTSLIKETEHAEAALARFGYAFLRECVEAGYGNTNTSYIQSIRSGQEVAVRRTYIRPLVTQHRVSPTISPAPVTSRGSYVSGATAERRRLRTPTWRDFLNPYIKQTYLYFDAGPEDQQTAKNFSASTRPVINASFFAHANPDTLRKGYAQAYSGRLAISALVAEGLRKAFAMPYEDASIFGELYDQWQMPEIGNGCGMSLMLADDLGIPVFDGLSERPAAFDEAIG